MRLLLQNVKRLTFLGHTVYTLAICMPRYYTASPENTCRILAGWPVRTSVTACESSEHQSTNRPNFSTHSFSTFDLKPFAVFASAVISSNKFHLETTRCKKKYLLECFLPSNGLDGGIKFSACPSVCVCLHKYTCAPRRLAFCVDTRIPERLVVVFWFLNNSVKNQPILIILVQIILQKCGTSVSNCPA